MVSVVSVMYSMTPFLLADEIDHGRLETDRRDIVVRRPWVQKRERKPWVRREIEARRWLHDGLRT